MQYKELHTDASDFLKLVFNHQIRYLKKKQICTYLKVHGHPLVSLH